MIPTDTMATKIPNKLGLTTFPSIIIEGRESAVTAIINANTVPIPTPLDTSASAIGRVPKISAYIGIPTKVAMITENGLFAPKTVSTHDCGIKP